MAITQKFWHVVLMAISAGLFPHPAWAGGRVVGVDLRAFQSVSHDLRVLNDVIALEIGKGLASGGGATLLTRVTVLQEADAQGQQGHRLAIAVNAVLAGEFAKARFTVWRNFPFFVSIHGDPIRYYPLFESVGTYDAILQVRQQGGEAQIVGNYLLPEDWAAQAEPAFRYACGHWRAFQKPVPADEVRNLRTLVGGDNAFLALAAAKALAPDPGNAPALLGAAEKCIGLRQAATLTILLCNVEPTPPALSSLLSGLREFIRDAPTSASLYGLALAVQFASDGRGTRELEADLVNPPAKVNFSQFTAADRLQAPLVRSIRRRYLQLSEEDPNDALAVVLELTPRWGRE